MKDNNPDIEEFIQLIRTNLPEASLLADALFGERGFEINELLNLWTETFAEITNLFISRKADEEAKKHFSFFSEQYKKGSEEIKKCIDTCYVENLFYEVSAEDKKRVFSLLPENLKELYVKMWGSGTEES